MLTNFGHAHERQRDLLVHRIVYNALQLLLGLLLLVKHSPSDVLEYAKGIWLIIHEHRLGLYVN